MKKTIDKSFEELENLMPSIKFLPGYFKHSQAQSLKLADWLERYQRLAEQFRNEFGSCVFSNFDTETTGLNPPSDFKSGLAGITDIAVSYMFEGEYFGNLIDENGNQSTEPNLFEFESLTNPGVEIPKEVVRLTGITNEMVENVLPQDKVIRMFKDYTDRSIFVGHNIGDSLHNPKGYDVYNVLGPIYERYFDISTQEMLERSIDTLPLFRYLVSGVSHTNENFCSMLGVTLKGAHRAMPDVRANALAFGRLKPFLDNLDVTALRQYALSLEDDRFYISKVRLGANGKDQWCEVSIRLKDQFKVVNKKGRSVVSYADAKIDSDGVHLSDQTLKDGTTLSSVDIEKDHPKSVILRKVLIHQQIQSLEDLLDQYVFQPVYW